MTGGCPLTPEASSCRGRTQGQRSRGKALRDPPEEVLPRNSLMQENGDSAGISEDHAGGIRDLGAEAVLFRSLRPPAFRFPPPPGFGEFQQPGVLGEADERVHLIPLAPGQRPPDLPRRSWTAADRPPKVGRRRKLAGYVGSLMAFVARFIATLFRHSVCNLSTQLSYSFMANLYIKII